MFKMEFFDVDHANDVTERLSAPATDYRQPAWPCGVSGYFRVVEYPGGAVVCEWRRRVMRQVVDGRMGYIGSVRDDVPHVTGQHAVTLKQWILEHRQELISSAAIAGNSTNESAA
ncbi:hypothetical protein G6M13_25440 [Agrobacterium tumefaciens]|nr:hypothetical protein [Agrobacterium tumefaciens]